MRVVIFCGGFGTRMWPASRKSFPKQFYPLLSGRSFFELTYKRFRKIFSPMEIFISTEARYVKYIQEQAPEAPKENIIAEPERKDNLAAVGLVTAVLEKRFPGEVMIVSWSDQIIEKESEFLKAIVAAGKYAGESGFIVSVDQEPQYPTTHNGWEKMGETIDEYRGFRVVRVTKHIEKPKELDAKRFFISGGYLITTGYRAWKTDVMLGYYKEYVPSVYQGLIKITEGMKHTYSQTVLFREYHKFVKDSVENAIFEKIPEDKRVAIPVDFGWKDAGTWELFYKSLKKKDEENVLEGGSQTESLESFGNLVIGPKGKMIALIGITDLVIIDTQDALLVSRMDKTADVKKLFGKLEEEKPEYVE